LANTRQIGKQMLRDYVNAISNHIVYEIYTAKDLQHHLENTYTNTYAKSLRNLFNYMKQNNELDSFNNIPIEKWLEAIKIRKTGIREVYISNDEIKDAFNNIDDKILFKCLVFSGSRLSQLVEGISLLNNAVIKDSFFRIPTQNISKGQKKSFWIYLPISMLDELKKYKVTSYDPKAISYKRVTANSVRKWFTNFFLQNGVSGDLVDFLQGRSAGSIRATHYMNMSLLSDLAYASIVDKLLLIL
jgi:intergrase/recombinase